MLKQFVLLVILLSLAACYRQKPLPYKGTEPVLMLTGDSGYIKKADAYKFMLAANLTDSTNAYNHEDSLITAGKYYRVKETGNYFVCFTNYQQKYTFETLVLAELAANGKLIKAEDYFHGNYCNCWNDGYAFYKYGDYYGVVTCGTGSAYSASYLNVFKEILPQDEVNTIPIAFWHGGTMQPESLFSEIEMADNSATIHYTLENGELTDSMDFIVKQTRTFDVHFTFENNTWVTTQMDKYEELDIGW